MSFAEKYYGLREIELHRLDLAIFGVVVTEFAYATFVAAFLRWAGVADDLWKIAAVSGGVVESVLLTTYVLWRDEPFTNWLRYAVSLPGVLMIVSTVTIFVPRLLLLSVPGCALLRSHSRARVVALVLLSGQQIWAASMEAQTPLMYVFALYLAIAGVFLVFSAPRDRNPVLQLTVSEPTNAASVCRISRIPLQFAATPTLMSPP